MEKNTIWEDTLHTLHYEEYEIIDEPKNEFGEFRQVLKFTLYDYQGQEDFEHITTIKDDIGTITFTDVCSVHNILETYTRRPLSDFDKVIIELDGSKEGKDINLDFSALTRIEECKVLHIVNTSAVRRLFVTMNMSATHDAEGNVEKEAMFDDVTFLRFENCVFPQGIKANDRDKLIIEFAGCDMYENLIFFDSRIPAPISTLSVKFENCSFYDMKTILVNRAINFILADCTMMNKKIPDKYYETAENLNIGDFINPSLRVENCENVEVIKFRYINMVTGIEFSKCKNFLMASVIGSHVLASKAISRTISVSECDSVKIADIEINGVIVDSCKDVNIAGVTISRKTASRAAFGIQVIRCTEKITICGIKPEADSVITGVSVSMCEGEVSLGDCIFEGIAIGAMFAGMEKDITIVSTVCTDITECAFVFKTCFGSSKLIDTVIKTSRAAVQATEGDELQLIGCTIHGFTSDGPTRLLRDIACKAYKSFSIVKETYVTGLSISLDTVQECIFENAVIERSYLDSDTVSEFMQKNVKYSAEDVTVKDEESAVQLKSIEKLDMRSCLFEDFYPIFLYVDTVLISKSVFSCGLRLDFSGDTDSEFSENQIGHDGSARYAKDIQALFLTACKGLTISENTFFSKSNTTCIDMRYCFCCILNNDNTYKNPNTSINVVPSEINCNHFTMFTKAYAELERLNQPSISTTSVFKELLYFQAKAEYLRRYRELPNFEEEFDVYETHKNIVSFSNPEDGWAPYFISSVNKTVKAICKSI